MDKYPRRPFDIIFDETFSIVAKKDEHCQLEKQVHRLFISLTWNILSILCNHSQASPLPPSISRIRSRNPSPSNIRKNTGRSDRTIKTTSSTSSTTLPFSHSWNYLWKIEIILWTPFSCKMLLRRTVFNARPVHSAPSRTIWTAI